MGVNSFLVRLYGVRRRSLRYVIRRLCLAFEGGEMTSETLREIFRRYHGVDVGMYSHGGCFVPFALGVNTTVGRYASIARGAFAATIDHPMGRKSMHAYFFNPSFGYAPEEREYRRLRIGNDVWLGHNSVIEPSVSEIGDGAVVGAGAVVHKNVPPYAVVVGNPARVVRYRFAPEVIEALLAERWWEKDIDELELSEFTKPYAGTE